MATKCKPQSWVLFTKFIAYRKLSHFNTPLTIQLTLYLINIMNDYLNSVIKQFDYYKSLAEKTFEQLPEDKLFWKYNNESNSIGILVNHITGNMLSRWTDFLNSDGEKEWRNRDSEFEDLIKSKEELLSKWNNARLNSIFQNDISRIF